MQNMQNSDEKKNIGKERVEKKYECAFKNGKKIRKKKDLHSFASLVIK